MPQPPQIGMPQAIRLLMPWGPWPAGARLFLQDGLYRDGKTDNCLMPQVVYQGYGVLCTSTDYTDQEHAA